jgi:hypothetical protein
MGDLKNEDLFRKRENIYGLFCWKMKRRYIMPLFDRGFKEVDNEN